jgi:hypothetical protein
MRRRRALIPILLLLPLTACEDPTGDATAAAPKSATAKPAAASPATSKPTVTRAKPSGSGNPGLGTQYAYLNSGDLATRRITYDLVEWFDGEEAAKACAEDGVQEAENGYCEGYYIRNKNTKLRTLTVDPDAPIRMTDVGKPKKTDLTKFLDAVGSGDMIRFDIDAGRIAKLDHVYLP